jgi:hypothetical protein
MPAPNVVNVSTITAKTNVLAVTNSATNIVENTSSSGQVYKINSLVVANINGTSSADITVSLFRSATEYKLAHTVVVPADASLVAISKDTALYLEEGDAIRLTASANSMLHAVCSYEVIS